tara:strand:- start:1897 stop:2118 length:222 start_codon:yes stop_codon:yes gene_type:complete
MTNDDDDMMMMMVEKMMMIKMIKMDVKMKNLLLSFLGAFFIDFVFFLCFLEKQEKKSIFFSRPFVWESYFTCT